MDSAKLDAALLARWRNGYSARIVAQAFGVSEGRVQEAINRAAARFKPKDTDHVSRPLGRRQYPNLQDAQRLQEVQREVHRYRRRGHEWLTPMDIEDLEQGACVAAIANTSSPRRAVFRSGRQLLNHGITDMPVDEYKPPIMLEMPQTEDDERDYSVWLSVDREAASPDTGLDNQSAIQLLDQKLRPEDARLLEQYYANGRSHREMATELGCSRPTVSRQIETARVHAEAILKAEGIRPEDLPARQS